MKKILFALMLSTSLFADQAVLYKTTGGSQSFDLSTLSISFPDSNSVSFNTTQMSVSFVSYVTFDTATTVVKNLEKFDISVRSGALVTKSLRMSVSGESCYDIRGRYMKKSSSSGIYINVNDKNYNLNRSF